jgi:hypothetical protein
MTVSFCSMPTKCFLFCFTSHIAPLILLYIVHYASCFVSYLTLRFLFCFILYITLPVLFHILHYASYFALYCTLRFLFCFISYIMVPILFYIVHYASCFVSYLTLRFLFCFILYIIFPFFIFHYIKMIHQDLSYTMYHIFADGNLTSVVINTVQCTANLTVPEYTLSVYYILFCPLTIKLYLLNSCEFNILSLKRNLLTKWFLCHPSKLRVHRKIKHKRELKLCPFDYSGVEVFKLQMQ